MWVYAWTMIIIMKIIVMSIIAIIVRVEMG